MKFDEIFMKAVEADLDANKVPMLLGEPGIGKSSFVEGLARDKRTRCFVLPCNQLADKADLTGARLIPDNAGSYKQVFYPHVVIADAIAYAKDNPGEEPILFLDEINRTTPDVTSEALSIPTNRSIGSASLPKNLRVMCAGNDKGNIISLDTASVNRFVLYHIQPDLDTFLSVNPDLNEYVVSTLKAHPDTLFGKTIVKAQSDDDDNNATIDDAFDEEDDGMQQLTSPRSITAVSDWLNHFDRDDLLEFLNEPSSDTETYDNSLTEIIEGHVGHTMFAVQLMATIVTALATPNNGAKATLKVSKPAAYDTLASLRGTSVREIEDHVKAMSDKDLSGCMVYALYERYDNRDIIDALAAHTTSIEPDDMNTLITLCQHNKVFMPNLEHVLDLADDGKHPFATNYRIVLSTWAMND